MAVNGSVGCHPERPCNGRSDLLVTATEEQKQVPPRASPSFEMTLHSVMRDFEQALKPAAFGDFLLICAARDLWAIVDLSDSMPGFRQL